MAKIEEEYDFSVSTIQKDIQSLQEQIKEKENLSFKKNCEISSLFHISCWEDVEKKFINDIEVPTEDLYLVRRIMQNVSFEKNNVKYVKRLNDQLFKMLEFFGVNCSSDHTFCDLAKFLFEKIAILREKPWFFGDVKNSIAIKMIDHAQTETFFMYYDSSNIIDEFRFFIRVKLDPSDYRSNYVSTIHLRDSFDNFMNIIDKTEDRFIKKENLRPLDVHFDFYKQLSTSELEPFLPDSKNVSEPKSGIYDNHKVVYLKMNNQFNRHFAAKLNLWKTMNLESHYFVYFYGIYQQDLKSANSIYWGIFTNYCSLRDYLKLQPLIFDEKMKNYIGSCLHAVQYIQSLGYVHNQLDHDNFYVNETCENLQLGCRELDLFLPITQIPLLSTVKINELSKKLSNKCIAPEVKNFRQLSFNTDIWSLCHTLFTLFVMPLSKYCKYFNSVKASRDEFGKRIRDGYKDLPEIRPTIEDLCNSFNDLCKKYVKCEKLREKLERYQKKADEVSIQISSLETITKEP